MKLKAVFNVSFAVAKAGDLPRLVPLRSHPHHEQESF